MRLHHLSLFPAPALFAFTSVSAMNNADLIKLKKADFSDATILLSINKESPDYDTSPSGLIELKNAGISESLIQRVVDRTSAGKTTNSTANTGQAAPAPSELFGIESPSIAPPFVEPVVGKEYFTRYTLHAEDGKYPITNYARGEVVPINTPVKLVALVGQKITLKRLDNGGDLKIENVEKYSQKTLLEVARLALSAEKTPIEALVPTLVTAIRSGDMRKGMTKEQVLMARGYPPTHETPSTDGDRWVYWSSRFIKQTIVFSNGRLVDGRGIF